MTRIMEPANTMNSDQRRRNHLVPDQLAHRTRADPRHRAQREGGMRADGAEKGRQIHANGGRWRSLEVTGGHSKTDREQG